MKKELKTQITRERIIDCALEEFSQSGYHAFVISRLTTKYGISKGLLYHNFSGKDALYQACVKESFKKAVEVIKGDAKEVPTLKEYMERRHRFHQEFPNHSHIFFEALVTMPEDFQGSLEKERAIFEELNRQVSQKLLSNASLKSHISKDKALNYLQFIQDLFRSYYLNLNQGSELSRRASEYENQLKDILDLMIYGILEEDEER